MSLWRHFRDSYACVTLVFRHGASIYLCRDYPLEVVSAPLKVWARVPLSIWYRYVYTSNSTVPKICRAVPCRAVPCQILARVNRVLELWKSKWLNDLRQNLHLKDLPVLGLRESLDYSCHLKTLSLGLFRLTSIVFLYRKNFGCLKNSDDLFSETFFVRN